MKELFTYLAASLFLLAFSMAPVTGYDDIVQALKSGNATQLARQFDQSVDLNIAGKSQTCNPAQGEALLKDFFAQHPVKNFQVIHKGQSAGSEFLIGQLQTRNGNYRVTLYMKLISNRQLIQDISFEAAD